jgi:hypothetical protein
MEIHMRRLLALIVTALAAVGLAVAVNPAGAATAHRVPATRKIVVRPVTATGIARSGFTVTAEPSGSVDCTFPVPSPAAVSPNIETCFPSAEYAVACWKAAAPHKVLCLRNARVHKLVRIPRHGAFPGTPIAPADKRAPLSMLLASGQYCGIRDGGAGPTRAGHPQWVATYYCNNGKAIWMRPGAAHFGVFEAFPSWTVIVAGESGPITTHHVAKAWFVGTFNG